jgi:hypothetical protein
MTRRDRPASVGCSCDPVLELGVSSMLVMGTPDSEGNS